MISRRRGYTLLEVILAIWLLGVFMLIASRVIVANFDTEKSTLLADGNTARFDRAIIALRGDVENSISVESPGPAVLRIHEAGNQTIEWRTGHHTLSRVTADNRVWEVGQSLSFKLDGAVVLLSGGGDEIALAGRGGAR